MSMDPSGAIGNVKARFERLKQSRAVYLAAKGTMVQVSQRVWGRGELTNGGTLSYNEDYELWAYTPPSPRKVTGKGKPYVDWIVRPESIAEKKQALQKSKRRLEKSYRNTTAEISGRTRSFGGEVGLRKLEERLARIETAINVVDGKLSAFGKRFGGNERKIKGGWYESYTKYKTQQGRGDSPFELTGRFRKAYFGGGDTPEPTQDSDTEVTIRLRGEEADKFKGLTDTKGPFLRLNDEEQAIFHKRVREIYVGE